MNKTILLAIAILLFGFIACSHGISNPPNSKDSVPIDSTSESSDRPKCLSLQFDLNYEFIQGFNAEGHFVSGFVKCDLNAEVGSCGEKAEGCYVDGQGVEKWFVGDWVSLCLIEAYDDRGNLMELQTDDCWCVRCFL